MIKNIGQAVPALKRTALLLAATLALVGIVGFLVLPHFVKSTLTDKLSTALHRPVTVAALKINPYAMSLTIDGLVVKDLAGDTNLASFERLYVNVEASSLFRGGVVVGELRLVKPAFHIVRGTDRRYNFSDLVDEALAKPKSEDKPASFAVRNIQLIGGAVVIDDRLLDEKHLLDEINIGVPFVSNMAYAIESFVEPSFAARVDGAPLAVKGRSKPFALSHESELALVADDLRLDKYADYLPPGLSAKIVSGTLDTDLKLVFRQASGAPSTLLLSGTAKVSDLALKESAGADLVKVKALEVAVGSADLIARKFTIDRVNVESPEISARVSADGVLNWNELYKAPAAAVPAPAAAVPAPAAAVPAPAAPPVPVETPAEAAAAPEWSLADVTVSGGALRWLDESNGKPLTASVEAIDIALKGLSSKAGVPALFDVTAKVVGEDLLKLDTLSISKGEIDLAAGEIRIGEIALRGGRAHLARNAAGAIEWLQPPRLRAAKTVETAAPAKPWKVSVAKASGEAIALRFDDRAMKPAAAQSIDDFAFEATDLSSEPGSTAQVAARLKLNGKGLVDVKGSVAASPLVATLKVEVKAVELLPLQPYFSERLNIDVTRGQLSVSGAVDLREAAATTTGLLPGFSGGFTGQASVANFYAVDKINAADFLRWKSFRVDKIAVKLGPDAVTIGDVALADFFARVIISAEGKLNLLQLVRSETAGAADVVAAADAGGVPTAKQASGNRTSVPVPEKDKPTLPVKIGKVGFKGGSVRFTDNFVKPNYTANLRDIAGSVVGLSSEAGTVAELEIKGNYESAPLTVSARLNPLLVRPYLDLEADVKGVEMTAFSSYAGKYAGYAIEKGKLSLFVKYKIENELLTAENRVFLDQLTLGDAVASPDATTLPVRLALSLLKNRAGEIDLNLPISGSLNDPEFSVGGLLVRVVVNLFVKAVTSPFALIGSMFGSSSGEELSSVEFDAGRAAITPTAQERLATLAKVLADRPALRLEVEGRYDAAADAVGLKKARLERKVRALKRDELTRAAVESGEEIVVSEKEYPVLLERVYKDEKFDKPRNAIGFAKSLPVAEMEALLLANASVDADDLRELGARRARTVRDALLAQGVGAARVFLLPSKAADDAAGGEAKASRSRVDFTLQ